eukprot:SAG31_NODE_37_length_31616_cov_38.688359_14_plen_105_part_00
MRGEQLDRPFGANIEASGGELLLQERVGGVVLCSDVGMPGGWDRRIAERLAGSGLRASSLVERAQDEDEVVRGVGGRPYGVAALSRLAPGFLGAHMGESARKVP